MTQQHSLLLLRIEPFCLSIFLPRTFQGSAREKRPQAAHRRIHGTLYFPTHIVVFFLRPWQTPHGTDAGTKQLKGDLTIPGMLRRSPLEPPARQPQMEGTLFARLRG